MIASNEAPGWVVYVVDDDPAVCSSLKFALEIDGFSVCTYARSEDVLAADLSCGGCMIVDYNLPGLNGLDLLRELDRRDVHLPAFLITSNPAQHVRRRASAQGVSIIEKPLLGNQLSEAVRESFTRSHLC
ncbi:response regulator [Xanthobacter dioxanivorans]|uniref:Response regulator n=1 Tax=Xanthobacter dioxanivorans TaxID=2528964 RepID=A0A974PRQ9_9HYPH|nr:response regulator [Xanthobacter dioxanivorans]QRG08118.1 response regulator [Xanthobacter dioxanivorans]